MKQAVGLLVAVFLVVFAVWIAPAKELKVVVPGVYAYKGVPEGTSDVLADLLLEALLSRHGIRALGPSDARAMLSAEQQKLLVGCKDESCMTELAGALGADWLIAGTVGKLEDLYVVSLQLIDARKARVTARATANLKSLKEAPEKLGGLVDKLLGQQPRVRTAPALKKQPEPKREPLDVRAFCRRIKAYKLQIKEKPYSSTLFEQRRELLEDLVYTPFQRQFDQKRGCIWSVAGNISGHLNQKVRRSNRTEETLDAKRRLQEWWDFEEQLKLLEEAYVRGLEMEKNGTGRRLTALPFAVKEAQVILPEDSREVRDYAQAYSEARKTLAAALKKAEKNDKEGFLKLFTPKDPKRSRTSPKYAFDGLRSSLKSGYKLSTCPYVTLRTRDIESSAARYQKTGEVEACWRKVKTDWVSTDNVWMKKHEGKWMIDRW
jgi:hypothetical protein